MSKMWCEGYSVLPFGLQVPNGETSDMEIPGKSSSESEPQGAAFSGGETLMGTSTHRVYKLCYNKLSHLLYLFLPYCNLVTFPFCFHSTLPQEKIPSWIWRAWLDQAWIASAVMKQLWQWSGAFWRRTQTWEKLWTLKRCTGPYRICITVWNGTLENTRILILMMAETAWSLLKGAAFCFCFLFCFVLLKFNILVTLLHISCLVFGWLLKQEQNRRH